MSRKCLRFFNFVLLFYRLWHVGLKVRSKSFDAKIFQKKAVYSKICEIERFQVI